MRVPINVNCKMGSGENAAQGVSWMKKLFMETMALSRQ